MAASSLDAPLRTPLPQAAIPLNVECSMTVKTHLKAIWRTVAWGPYLASCSNDGAIKWIDKKGACVRNITFDSGAVFWLDVWNEFLVSCHESGAIHLWNAEGVCVSTLSGHSRRVRVTVVWDGCLVSGDGGGTIKKWSTDGTCLASFLGHKEHKAVRGLVVWGDRLASCSYDTTIKIWDAQGECVGVAHHKEDVNTLAVWNRKLASGSDDKTIRVWDKDLHCVYTFPAHAEGIYGLMVWGKYLVSCGDCVIRIWSENIHPTVILRTLLLAKRRDRTASHTTKALTSSPNKGSTLRCVPQELLTLVAEFLPDSCEMAAELVGHKARVFGVNNCYGDLVSCSALPEPVIKVWRMTCSVFSRLEDNVVSQTITESAISGQEAAAR
eukprot:NODE_478_length_1624_cov_122.462222_g362_i0.p1 GENE.NODE_478_length_1624_cov_122.462222_g362_i0~~NODE_478_length_1624_cov_122.462222_g362_i0.p1  ORF type:complete len:382 (+),score=58.79 NODE_478_length_1624_cov_122.462222_g362_i0:81-1226(+)